MAATSAPVSPRTVQRPFAAAAASTPSTSSSSSSSSSSDTDELDHSSPSPRPASPVSTRRNVSRMRKLVAASKWIQSSYSHSSQELDFGCAGDWTAQGPEDLGDRFYSTAPGGANRASTSSSVLLPSLTHSRAHSASSDFSVVSTVDSSLPPSPTQAHCAVLAPLSPYTSRVPLTPRTAQRKRQCDEVAAVEAVNDYFFRVRLSQIQEADDAATSSIISPRGSVSAQTVKGDSVGVEGLGIKRASTERRPSKSSLSESTKRNARGSSSGVDVDFAVEFGYLAPGFSTYVPFDESPSSPSFFSDVRETDRSTSPTCSSSDESTVPARTPPIISDDESALEGELDELSEFFANPATHHNPIPRSPTTTSLREVASMRKRPTTTYLRSTCPTPPSPRTRVDYTWI